MADTMTLEQVRDWHCRFAETHNEDDTNTFHTKMADAIDAAIKQRERDSKDAAKYRELLMAVSNKFPYESRHETALRYIRERENQLCVPKYDAEMAKDSSNE